MRNWIISGLAVAAMLLACSTPAQATILTPGTAGFTTGTPVALPGAPNATITATITGGSFPNGVTVTENVYLGATNGGITGTLFTYQFTNDTGSHGKNATMDSVSLSNYNANLGTIDADYSAISTGTGAPLLVSWNPPAVDFTAFNLGVGLAPGATSKVLYIQTDAKGYALNGTVGVIDSVPTFGTPFYDPSPEPASLLLLGGLSLGLGGTGIRRWWKKRAVVA